MPKMKSHSGAKKRFKVTGSGKLIHKRAGKGHLNEHKTARRKRHLNSDAVITGADALKMTELLAGYKPKSKRN